MRKMSLTMILLIMLLVGLWFFGMTIYSTSPKAESTDTLPANAVFPTEEVRQQTQK